MTDQPQPDKKPDQDTKTSTAPENGKPSDGEKESPQTKAIDASPNEQTSLGKTAPLPSDEAASKPPVSDDQATAAPAKPASSEKQAEGGQLGEGKASEPKDENNPSGAVSEAAKAGESKAGDTAKAESKKPESSSESEPESRQKSSETKAPQPSQSTRNFNDPEFLKSVLTPNMASEPKVTQRLPEHESPSKESSANPTSATQICPTCGHRNRPGIILCENCGTNLMTGQKSALGTRDLKKEQEAKAGTDESLLDTSQTEAMEMAGGSVFTEKMILRIEIEGGSTPMLVYPKQEIIMGRRDPNTGGMPDVDLTAYAGYRMGVSRRHAAIRLQEQHLHVSDLGSSNGTFLNGTRLNAHRPYQLRDGDEVRLGQMVLKVFFQSNKDHK